MEAVSSAPPTCCGLDLLTPYCPVCGKRAERADRVIYVRLTASQHERLKELARERGVSLNRLCVETLGAVTTTFALRCAPQCSAASRIALKRRFTRHNDLIPRVSLPRCESRRFPQSRNATTFLWHHRRASRLSDSLCRTPRYCALRRHESRLYATNSFCTSSRFAMPRFASQRCVPKRSALRFNSTTFLNHFYVSLRFALLCVASQCCKTLLNSTTSLELSPRFVALRNVTPRNKSNRVTTNL